jgi:hypothetical protein
MLYNIHMEDVDGRLSQLRVDVPAEHVDQVIELLGAFASEHDVTVVAEKVAEPVTETRKPRPDWVEWVTDETSGEKVAVITREKLVDFDVSVRGSNGTPATRAFNSVVNTSHDKVAAAWNVDLSPFFARGTREDSTSAVGIRSDMMEGFMAELRGASRFISNFGSGSSELFEQFYAHCYLPAEPAC